MAEVVDIETFNRYVSRLNDLESELIFQRKVLGALIWLTKEQTMQILQLGRTSLWTIVKNNDIAYQKEGTRIMFHIDSVRAYLMAKKIPERYAQERIQEVVTTKKTGFTTGKAGSSQVASP